MNGADRGEAVHVSLAELRTAARRALEGAGAPAGTERDGARSAAWLESCGLRGAAALVSNLPDVARSGSRPPDIAGNHVDLASHSVFVWGSTLVELAMLGAGAAINLWGCRTPRALLPEAAVHAREGWYFQLRAGASRALITNGEMTLDQSFAELETADVRLVAGRSRPRTDLPTISSVTASELEARHAASLANGLRLAPGDWRAIREAAARILVPASERSRSRGAGAEVDDNE